MAIVYTDSTNKFVKELNHIQKTKTSQGTRLYTGDTSKFEPVEQNRDHLINTLIPMVMQLAKSQASKYNHKIEYEDCISAGLYGATVATDIYIQRSKEKVQDAKLSTFAHFYITKHIKEYCRNNMTILSSGPTKVREATECFVYEGNKTSENDEGTAEYFETSGEINLMYEDSLQAEATITELASTLLSTLNNTQKKIVEYAFGIGHKQPVNERKIAKSLNLHTSEVKSIIQQSIQQLQQRFKHSVEAEVFDEMM